MKRTRKRGREEMIADLLKSAQKGRKRFVLSQDVHVNYLTFRGYLKLALEENLITYDEETGLCKTTEKGENYVRTYQNLINLVSAWTRWR